MATVRPETIVADTAVAVNPDDERYRHLVGRHVIVPLVNREVPIIADAYVKIDFGTGALKVTPGHAIEDFEIGRRHDLAELSAIGYDGRMTELAGEFAGMTVADARVAMRDALEAAGLLVSERTYEHEVGHCDRTGDTIEPLISLQWFMHMHELAAPANAAVRSGRVRFHPKSQENTYFGWMDNLRPWCISRQLWWGHQIPVWYCDSGHVTVAADEPGGAVPSAARTRARARRRRARYVVFLGVVAVCHHRLAGWRRSPAGEVLPRGRALDRPRHHQPVGRADDDDGDRVHGGYPVHRRVDPLHHPGTRRPAHVQVARHGHRPARAG